MASFGLNSRSNEGFYWWSPGLSTRLVSFLLNGEPFADLDYILKNSKRVTGVLHRRVEAESPFHVAVHWNAGNNETLAWTTGKLWRSIK